jgi:hypothetical protein
LIKIKKFGDSYKGIYRLKDQFFVEITKTSMTNNKTLFLVGIAVGAAFELIKNHLVIGDISFYKTFREKNVPRELQGYEEHLKDREQKILKCLENMIEANK